MDTLYRIALLRVLLQAKLITIAEYHALLR